MESTRVGSVARLVIVARMPHKRHPIVTEPTPFCNKPLSSHAARARQSNSMLFRNLLFVFGLSALFCGCAPIPVTELPMVGPQPVAVVKKGYLIVDSATEEHNDADVHRYPHTSYQLYRPNGRLIRNVANHISLNDETAETVALPAGTYFIIAESEIHGRVKVPVRIAASRVTVVNLERR